MDELFPGEMQALGRQLTYLAHQEDHHIKLAPEELINAFTEVTACLPVYRIYIRNYRISQQDPTL